MNSVAIVGNLTADPELRHTDSGAAVCSFTVAVNEKYKDKQETYWIDCVAWNKTAELLVQYFRKGNRIGVEGKLTTRTWEGKNGKVKSTEINVSNITFLNEKAKVAEAPANEAPVEIEDEDLPF